MNTLPPGFESVRPGVETDTGVPMEPKVPLPCRVRALAVTAPAVCVTEPALLSVTAPPVPRLAPSAMPPDPALSVMAPAPALTTFAPAEREIPAVAAVVSVRALAELYAPELPSALGLSAIVMFPVPAVGVPEVVMNTLALPRAVRIEPHVRVDGPVTEAKGLPLEPVPPTLESCGVLSL